MRPAWLLSAKLRGAKQVPVLKDVSDLHLLFAMNSMEDKFLLKSSDPNHACLKTGWLASAVDMLEMPTVPANIYPFEVGGAACDTLEDYGRLRAVAASAHTFNTFVCNPSATTASAVQACLAQTPDHWPVNMPQCETGKVIYALQGMRQTVHQYTLLLDCTECPPGGAAWSDGIIDIKQLQGDACMAHASTHMSQLANTYTLAGLNKAVAWSNAAASFTGKPHGPTTIAERAATRTRTALTPDTATVTAALALMTTRSPIE